MYYPGLGADCTGWAVPLGTTTAGNLHDALAAGLPEYSFVTPNLCNDMHGAPACPTSWVKRGDDWLARAAVSEFAVVVHGTIADAEVVAARLVAAVEPVVTANGTCV